MSSLKRALVFSTVLMIGVSEVYALDPIRQKEERLKELQKKIDEKKREIEDAEGEADQLKEDLKNTKGNLDRTEQLLTDTHRKKVIIQRKAQAQSRSLKKTVVNQEVSRRALTQLWTSYEKNLLKKDSGQPEKPRLLAMALSAQTQAYEKISEQAGHLKVRVESLTTKSHELTREEYKKQRQKTEVLKAYRERNAKYNEVQARKESLNREIQGLEETATQLTNLVNSLRKQKAAQRAKVSEKGGISQPLEKLPLREENLLWPVSGQIIKKFGKSIQPELLTPVVSNGLLIRCPPGTPVRAVANGKVLYAGPFMSYGHIVLVEHPGDWHSIYGQLQGPLPAAESLIKRGDVVGHAELAYFEIRIHGKPIDPLPWFTSH